MIRTATLTAIATCAIAFVGLTMTGCGSTSIAHGLRSDTSLIGYTNDYFYPDGEFDAERGKDAIIDLMRYHNYPVDEQMREQLWVSDYGTGQFTKLGLSIRMWVDNKEDNYMLMDMFLLPGQMLPEHTHRPNSVHAHSHDGQHHAHGPAKAEAWLVRNGVSYVVGMGDDNLDEFPITIPLVHRNGFAEARNVVKGTEGTVVILQNAQQSPPHWQFAGPEGAIITEVASNHSLPDVVYQDEELNSFINGEE